MRLHWLTSTLCLAISFPLGNAWSQGRSYRSLADSPQIYITSAPGVQDGIFGILPSGALCTIVPPTGEWDGLLELDLSADGSLLYVLQSNHGTGVHRVLVFETDGTLVRKFEGFSSTLMAMTVLDNGEIYLLHTNASGQNSRVLRVDPQTGQITVHFDFGQAWTLRDMDHDESGNLYFTGGPGPPNSIGVFKITPDGHLSLHAALLFCSGIEYHAETRTFWTTVNLAGASAYVYTVDLGGNVQFYSGVLGFTQPSVRGISFDPVRSAPVIGLGGPGKVGYIGMDWQFHGIADLLWPIDVDVVP